ncbi:uncharacterized protein LOC111069320 [Drosophila obscura]|uniref:uncharacterized protein LOC111069320 n=1 Tax=Drosophila obscura TaxID=7282 RepID=UPI001BB1F574|nr:uncharacterized protein LOC111069320 [Drosophila obscura]XP_022215021.2 uncharacterized protein LOC111069320 [Drosophila obscura]
MWPTVQASTTTVRTTRATSTSVSATATTSLQSNSSSSNRRSSINSAIAATNRCLIKSAIERSVVRPIAIGGIIGHKAQATVATEDVLTVAAEDVATVATEDVPVVNTTELEYDIINYYTDAPSSTTPCLAGSHRQQQPTICPPLLQGSGSGSGSTSARRCSRLIGNHQPTLDTGAVEAGLATDAAATACGSLSADQETTQEEEFDLFAEDSHTSKPPPSFTTKTLRCRSTAAALDMDARSRGGGGTQSRQRKARAIVTPRTALSSSSNASTGDSRSPNSTPSSTLGVNMRVTGQCSQGGRKYMEDQFSVAYQESPLTHELEYAFFGIYDGHGGPEAAFFAKEHLMLEIVRQKQFWSDNDEDVLKAIREGYISTHFAMWREQEKWPRTANGHLSTAGTTATVAFMRREKIYIGHVGDSGIVLGYQQPNERQWRAKQLTTDHKPESHEEKSRIQRSGGMVAIKSGVPRVVWNRPRDPQHRGPIRRRTAIDDIPFLAVARSLGDLWSYNSRCKEFVVSPDPEVKVVKIDPNMFRCLIFGTDGLWNVVTAQEAVDAVRKQHLIGEILNEQDVMNPSKALVDRALKTWASKKMRADNTSVVTVILTPSSTTSGSSQKPSPVPSPSPCPVQPSAPSGREIDLRRELDASDMEVEVDVDALLDADDEDSAMDSENSCPDPHCIEEENYILDAPYSALAKRHLPPEPFRNFDYYAVEEEQEEEDADEYIDGEPIDHAEDEEAGDEDAAAAAVSLQQRLPRFSYDAQRLKLSLHNHRKMWRKSNTAGVYPWRGLIEQQLQHQQQEAEAGDVVMLEQEHHLHHYSNGSSHIDRAAIYGQSVTNSSNGGGGGRELTELEHHLEQHLENSFGSYGSSVCSLGSDYSFAESYNTLLNEQEQEARSRSAAAAAEAEAAAAAALDDRSMQEIIQEQQHYQQQEGYSLTQLETRREQLHQVHSHQPQDQEPEQEQETWTPSDYVEQQAHQEEEPAKEPEPSELLELNALLQQERAEEQQVALEREQQLLREQEHEHEHMEATSSSSTSTSSSSCSETEFVFTSSWTSAALKETTTETEPQEGEEDEKESSSPPPAPSPPTLQDNKVSSTLPSTPTSASEAGLTPAMLQLRETVAEIRKEDAHAVHYIIEQIQKLQEVDCMPVTAAPGIGEALDRASALASDLSAAAAPSASSMAATSPVATQRIRQMRRYRNVPNENHQHMQTRLRQVFKHCKNKSLSAAAIKEAASGAGAAASAVGGAAAAAIAAGAGGAGNSSSTVVIAARRSINTTPSSTKSNSNGNSRSSSSGSSIMMTRRSQTLAISGGGGAVSKRQLRSCSVSGMDMTKRTLRTRNVPTVGVGATAVNVPTAAASTARVDSAGRGGANSTANVGTASASGSSNGSNAASRRLKRTQQEREQRRSLRRSTLNAPMPGGGANSGSSSSTASPFSKPTRLQSSCNGAISARPPPSPKKLNIVVPTLAIGTRAYTAAMAASAVQLNKRWSLRSSRPAAAAGGQRSAIRNGEQQRHQQQQ